MDKKLDAKRCYETLGLQLDASQEQIKSAWRQLVIQWHPDKVAHNQKLQSIAQEEMKTINLAYDFLKSYQPVPLSTAPSAEAQGQVHKQEREAEEARRKEQEEKRQRERKWQEREAEQLRMRQEAETTYQREQIAIAQEEARKKEESAKLLRAQEAGRSALPLNKYEAVFIIPANITDAEIHLTISKYRQVVERNHGEIEKIDVWELRKLTYEIKGHKEGIYVIMVFSGSELTEAVLREAFQIGEDHIRFMVIPHEGGSVL